MRATLRLKLLLCFSDYSFSYCLPVSECLMALEDMMAQWESFNLTNEEEHTAVEVDRQAAEVRQILWGLA